jgi:hypothetical protein
VPDKESEYVPVTVCGVLSRKEKMCHSTYARFQEGILIVYPIDAMCQIEILRTYLETREFLGTYQARVSGCHM